MRHLHPLHRQEAEPDVKGHLGIGQVFPDPARDIQERFLQHVVRRHTTGQAPIQPNVQHPPQPFTVEHEQLAEGLAIVRAQALEQYCGLLVNVHRHALPSLVKHRSGF